MTTMNRLEISAQTYSFVQREWKTPSWATGHISQSDAQFICELIRRERPSKCVEIGIASGVSTTFLSLCLSSVNDQAHLHSFDPLTYFYARPDIPCGAFVTETFHGMPRNVSLHLGKSSLDIFSTLGNQQFDFCFIDGSHDNPWPVLDLLSVVRIMKPNSWVVLHDINLPYLHKQFQHFGAHYLFNIWEGGKLLPSYANPNIGAIQLHADAQKSIDNAIKCLAMPWGVTKVRREDFAKAKMAAALQGGPSEPLFDKFSERPEPKEVTAGSFSVSNHNPLTKLDYFPWKQPMTLGVNPPSQPAFRVWIQEIQTGSAEFLVCPAISGHGQKKNLSVVLQSYDAVGLPFDKREVVLDHNVFPSSAILRVPERLASVLVEVTTDIESTLPRSVDFSKMYFT